MTDQPFTDSELRHQLEDVIKSLGAAETELAQYRRRNRLAHKARRAKEHQLDGIRRALCDIGAIQDDDPYSHADLEDVIRQVGRLDELSAAVAADLDSYGEDEDQHCAPVVPPSLLKAFAEDTAARAEHAAAVEAAVTVPEPDLPPGFGTVAPCTTPRPTPAPRILAEQIADTIEHALMPVISVREVRQETARRTANDVLAVILPASPSAGLREQLAAPIDRILSDWPEHNRTDEHEAVRNEITEAVLAVIPAATRIAADRARDSETTVQRVVDLYERWVKAGPPPLGAPLARWWDKRLVELREAVLGTKDPS
ncbi:hypothetical protein [Streptomyces brasiliscabiei]|uniref:hypothetical protein n=1 Tax=Streptomyces brasiliscabiei TaxID=2736302 RepID=UPI0038F6B911